MKMAERSSISPFPTVFSKDVGKDVYYSEVKTRACLGKGYVCFLNETLTTFAVLPTLSKVAEYVTFPPTSGY